MPRYTLAMHARWKYLLAAFAVIPVGLATRSDAIPWPTFVVEHGGDALYALMVYLGFRALKPDARNHFTLAAALGFCFAIEVSQLYQAPWISGLRETLPGRLVLGRGFVWADFVRYAAGALGGFGLDRRRGRAETGE